MNSKVKDQVSGELEDPLETFKKRALEAEAQLAKSEAVIRDLESQIKDAPTVKPLGIKEHVQAAIDLYNKITNKTHDEREVVKLLSTALAGMNG